MAINIAWFKDLGDDSLTVAGGKGTNLGIMYKLGLPIPNGFVVTAQCYKSFIEQTNIKDKILDLLKGLDVNNTSDLQLYSKKVRELIRATPMPDSIREEIIESYEVLSADRRNADHFVNSPEAFVAVRSSATAEDLPQASFAGQQASFLNVQGKNALVESVQNCWASLFTARAVYYRAKQGFATEQVFIAVVVQRMVNSEKSGIMFTANPATNNLDQIVIEGVYGLGEAIVSGSVNPDLYIVRKRDREIVTREIKKQDWGLFRDEKGHNVKRDIDALNQKRQTITDKEIQELARLGTKIEKHYARPQDIEWAIEAGNVMIVQSRAITTIDSSVQNNETALSSATNTPLEQGKIIVRGETASRGAYSGPVKLVKDLAELSRVEKGDVLVTRMTTPDMVPSMQKAGAIVTDEGGLTCHAAIVSREMGTPCIVGTEVATQVLTDGQIVTVDATHGLVYEGNIELAHDVRAESHNLASSTQGETIVTATDIKVILDLPQTAQRAAATGADGVGLVRLEIMIAQGGVHPAQYVRENRVEEYVALLEKGISEIAKAFSPRPVWVRCSDMRSDEYRNLEGGSQEPQESDPMIGWHAIRRLLDEPKILAAEFEALKRVHAQGYTNVGVMLPFVIRRSELKEAKDIMRKVGLEPCQDIAFGVMIETPASCWIIEELCREGISFVSFGTNDLTQLTLGIDRNNAKIAKLFDEMHPAVLGQIAKVIKTCRKYNVITSICGQAGSRPEMAEFLVHQGVGSISSNVDAVGSIRKTVARVEKRILLDAERQE